MADAATESLSREWLLKAEEDLRSARLLAGGGMGLPTLFHCQQAIEKALKAYLCFHQVAIPKTHDLGYLCDLAGDVDPVWLAEKDVAEAFTSYGVEMRYPGAGSSPVSSSVVTELSAANDLVLRIVQSLPATLSSGIEFNVA